MNTRLTKFIIAVVTITLGLLLTGLNIYGLTRSLEPDIKKLDLTYGLRFPYEIKETYDDTILNINNTSLIKIRDFVEHVTEAIKNRMTHPNWNKIPVGEFNISVPIWENYILYFLTKINKSPQIQRYHFSNYKKSLERGIGICGDSAIILSSILRLNNIEHSILSFDGHVLIQFYDETNTKHVTDPDFNVTFQSSASDIKTSKNAYQTYIKKGYSKNEVDYIFEIYKSNPAIFKNHIDFMKKRYYFEKASYILKWLIPFFLIIVASLSVKKSFKY